LEKSLFKLHVHVARVERLLQIVGGAFWEAAMPLDETKLKSLGVRADIVFSRIDRDSATLRQYLEKFARCVGDNARLLEQITSNGTARANLLTFSARAVKLADAYSLNAANLRDEAEISGELMEINARLSALYAVVAVGKVFDAIASATGTGKVVTSAKNSFLEIAEGMRKDDPLKASAQTANLTLMMVGGEWSEFTKDFDDLQKTLDAILGLIKNLKDIWRANDISKVLPQFRSAVPQMLGLFAKVAGTLKHLTTFWSLYQKSQIDKLPISLTTGKMVGGPQLAPVAMDRAKNLADDLNVIKYGFEAIENVWRSACSAMDFWESWDAKSQTDALGKSQLGGGQRMILDLNLIAGLSGAQMTDVVRTLSNATDARQLAMDAFSKAQKLKQEAARMSLQQTTNEALIGPVNGALNDTVAGLRAADKELEGLRRELCGLEPGHDVYSLKVAVWLSAIDSKRARLAETVGEW
jgi:hypothetical protein